LDWKSEKLQDGLFFSSIKDLIMNQKIVSNVKNFGKFQQNFSISQIDILNLYLKLLKDSSPFQMSEIENYMLGL